MVSNGNTQSGESTNVKLHSSTPIVPKRKCSENLFGEQLISEGNKEMNGDSYSELTLDQYQNMSTEEKSRLSNRVQQWALKARNTLPNEHGLSCLVVGHLLKNAHRYFGRDKPSALQQFSVNSQKNIDESREKVIKEFKDSNKKM